MKHYFPGLILAALSLCSCTSNNAKKVLKKWDATYHEKALKPASFQVNDTLRLVYFEDTIRGLPFAMYLHSDLEVVSVIRKPGNYEMMRPEISTQDAFVVVNDEITKLHLKNFSPSTMMQPNAAAAFKIHGKYYLVVKLTMISFMAGDYWYTLILELNKDGRVIHQQGFDTSGELNFKAIKARLQPAADSAAHR